jgi:hypothetical protein
MMEAASHWDNCTTIGAFVPSIPTTTSCVFSWTAWGCRKIGEAVFWA